MDRFKVGDLVRLKPNAPLAFKQGWALHFGARMDVKITGISSPGPGEIRLGPDGRGCSKDVLMKSPARKELGPALVSFRHKGDEVFRLNIKLTGQAK